MHSSDETFAILVHGRGRDCLTSVGLWRTQIEMLTSALQLCANAKTNWGGEDKALTLDLVLTYHFSINNKSNKISCLSVLYS